MWRSNKVLPCLGPPVRGVKSQLLGVDYATPFVGELLKGHQRSSPSFQWDVTKEERRRDRLVAMPGLRNSGEDREMTMDTRLGHRRETSNGIGPRSPTLAP